jgi:hypothetical protein
MRGIAQTLKTDIDPGYPSIGEYWKALGNFVAEDAALRGCG